MIFKKLKSFVGSLGTDSCNLVSAAKSHVGKVRTNNEDSFLCSSATGLYIVCDGMGGHRGGEVASQLAVEVVGRHMDGGCTLTQAIEAAHQEIAGLKVNEEGNTARPGCTIVALKLDRGRYQIGWVGDSRIWLLHKGELQQLSVDHTVVQQMVNWGDISNEEALTHPDRNRLSQALGTGQTSPVVGVEEGFIKKNMIFLLATDGMAHWNEMDQLAELLANNQPGAAVDKLIALSLDAGGRDNITCVVVGCQ